MANINYDDVVKLAEQLPPHEQRALVAHLQELAEHRQLTKDERKVLLESMTLDLGTVSPGYSDRREDWYGDDQR